MNIRTSWAAAALLAAFASAPSIVAAQASSPPAPADPDPPSSAAADEEREKLEEEIRREMGRGAGARSGAAQGAAAEGSQAGTGGSAFGRLLLLPDLSAIGNVSADWNDTTDEVGFTFEELELGLQAVVDPYVRADVFIAFSDEGAEVEEAFVTTLGLPAHFQLRAGRFFSPFGRLNQTHPHAQEFIETPLAGRILAEENLKGDGLVVSWLAPVSWFAQLELGAQSTAPEPEDESRLTGFARLSQYIPLGAATTLGLGLSGARRDEGVSPFRDLLGADAHLRIRPPGSRSYLTVTAEIHARRFVDVPDVSEDFDEGWWAQALYRVTPRWGLGARYEEAPALDLPGDEKRTTALLAWLPSEFMRIRLEGSYDRLPDDVDEVGILLNLEFGIGAHGAHPF